MQLWGHSSGKAYRHAAANGDFAGQPKCNIAYKIQAVHMCNRASEEHLTDDKKQRVSIAKGSSLSQICMK